MVATLVIVQDQEIVLIALDDHGRTEFLEVAFDKLPDLERGELKLLVLRHRT
jgi:hypothetical protein